MATQYQKIPVPGFTSPTADYTDPEILYSTVGFTQKGVTIAGGQGVLPAGTVLGRKTSDKKYYAYSNANSNGTETALGILRRPVDTGGPGSADQESNIVIAGMVKLNMVHGADAAALTDLGATTNTAFGYLKF